jgi:serine/threonine protein kinase
MYDISIYGLGRRSIQDDLSDLSANLPTWRDLLVLRDIIPGLLDYRILAKRIEDMSGNVWLPAFSWDVLLSTGAYGKIYKGHRAIYVQQSETNHYKLEGTETIVLKEIAIEKNIHDDDHEQAVRVIMYEATIHALVVQLFKRIQWSFAVPKLYEIFARGAQNIKSPLDVREVVFGMEYIRGTTLYDFLKDRYAPKSRESNSTIYIRILAEVALQLHQIQIHLRMNHRDMKVNNVLIRPREATWEPVFSRFYPALSKLDTFGFNVVLIDYGFACIACGDSHDPPEISLLEAGSWFGPTDSCFKTGRDLTQFIYCMECYFPSAIYFTPDLAALIKKWMRVSYSGGEANLLYGVQEDGRPNGIPLKLKFDTGIYEFLRRSEVNPSHCSPQAVLEDICTLI